MRVMINLPDELAAWLEHWQRPGVSMSAPLRTKVLAVLQDAHDDDFARMEAEASRTAGKTVGLSKDDDLPF